MHNHRIRLVAFFSALAVCAPATFAQSSSTANATPPPSASDTATQSPSSTPDRSAGAAAASDSDRPSDSASAASTDASAAGSPAAAAPGVTASDSDSYRATSQATMANPAAPLGQASTGLSGAHVQRVDESQIEHRRLADFKGREVIGAGGEQLGKVNDFLIDPRSGDIAGVVVSSGGFLGLGAKLRVLSQEQLDASRADQKLNAQLDKNGFEQLSTVSKDDLDGGRIPTATAGAQSPAGGGSASTLVRASQLDGKELRSQSGEIGDIEDIVVDLAQGRAMAVVEVESEFAGEDGQFLIGFDRLDLASADATTIATSLRREDFSDRSAAMAAADTSGAATGQDDAASSPTGRDSSVAATGTTANSADNSATVQHHSTTVAPGPEGPTVAATDPAPAQSDSGNYVSTPQGSVDARSDTSAQSAAGTVASTQDASPPATDSSRSQSGAGIGQDDDTLGPTGRTAASTSASSTGSASRLGEETDRANEPGTGSARAQGSSSGESAANESERTRPAASGAGSDQDEQLTPTGRGSGFAGAEAAGSEGTAHVTAIREALKSGDTLEPRDAEAIQVMHEEDKIVLKGSVSQKDARDHAERLAKQAAPGAEIDNQIEVQER